MKQNYTLPDDFTIRRAEPSDVPLILTFINELAVYEKLSHEVVATPELLERYLFGEEKIAHVVLGFERDEPVGFALYFLNFSTFVGRPGIYLEDLFVREAYRGKGYGKALLVHLANIAVENGYGRFEWAVLDWNTPAIEFYRSLGAQTMDEWIIHRVDGEALKKLGGSFF